MSTDLESQEPLNTVRVGIIGLGEVAQIIHLPILRALPDLYEIAAVCDVSPELLACIGGQYRVDRRYADYHELVAQSDLDAVFVLNSNEYHADCTVATVEAGKHVLVEKPMCLTISDARRIIEARDRAGVQVMVGYMRRFAPAFVAAVEEVRALERINYARVRDIIGANRLIVEQSSAVHRFPIPRDGTKDRSERAERMLREALGDARKDIQAAYMQLCGLGCHDLSAMRELLGRPERVASAVQWKGGKFITAIFEYSGYYAMYETGVDLQRRFDAHLEVYGDQKSIRVQYDTPYIRHMPTTLVVAETVGDAYAECVTRPTFKDPYTHELEYFHRVVTEGIVPKAGPEDSLEDLELFEEIVHAFE